jgi:prophage DNA circulation protein
MRITDPRLNTLNGAPTWRTHWLQALFRDEIFFVENQSRTSGRRVAVHEYPKRNVPYAEDMGRMARAFAVQGYLIGPFYHELKDKLIDALEKDGPGRLRLPMQYQLSDVQVMVQGYSISENRERGGMCSVEMNFVEYGDPLFRHNISTPGEVMQGAANVESMMVRLQEVTTQLQKEMAAYAEVHKQANVPNETPPIEPFEPSNADSQTFNSGLAF